MARTFSKKGLRRDLNFLDLLNPRESLNNLLDGLPSDTGDTFISEDLNAIRDIRTNGMSNADFLNIANIAPRFVEDNDETKIYELKIYEPTITVKNRIDEIRFTTGEPRFFGGNGLTARYFEDAQVDSTATNVTDIFTGEPALQEIFWEDGNFNFITIPEVQSIFGGVSFSGFFKPTSLGTWAMPFSTTGFFTAEFDYGTGYEVLVRKSQVEYDFSVNAQTAGQDTLTLQTPANAVNILVGDRIVNTSIAQFNDPDNPVTVTSVIQSTGQIGLSAPLASNVPDATTFTFEFQFGIEGGSGTLVLENLEEFVPYGIRFQFWFPEEDFVTVDMVRSLSLDLTPPASSTRDLNFKYLYDEDYNLNPDPTSEDFGDFTKFYNNRLNVGGGSVGGITEYADYQKIETIGTLDIKYEPPVSLANATKAVYNNVFYFSESDVVPLSITDSIEIGNYVFGAGIASGTRVRDISLNNFVRLDADPISTELSDTVTFIDHRGLNTFDTGGSWTSGNASITGLSTSTTDKIRVGDIVVANGSPQYNRVLSVGSTSVTTSVSFTAFENGSLVLFYDAQGLYNNSLVTYCQNVFSAVTTNTTTSGNTITVEDDTNLAVGQVVQFGDRIPDNTTVESITPNGADFDIELSNDVNSTITSGQLITFAPAGTTESKELCFPPTDTSPPFNATEFGLETTNDEPSMTLVSTATNELRFVGLSAEEVTVESASVSDTYDRTISITDGAGNAYKILGSTT